MAEIGDTSLRVKGAILGAVLGDCLGMPYEFTRKRNQGLDDYSPAVTVTTHHSQWQGSRSTDLGQGSDDTEMMLAILGSIADCGAYRSDDVVLRYMIFANFSSFCGHNTRNLFKGVKTIAGYRRRYKESLMMEPSQSNGFLMRAPAFAVLNFKCEAELLKICVEDASLTNPGPVNSAFAFVYSSILNFLCYRPDYDILPAMVHTFVIRAGEFFPDAQEILGTLLTPTVPDITGKDKGWARHALHLAISILLDPNVESYAMGVELAIKKGGDTDTNGCIVGAFLGARFGLDSMLSDAITRVNLDKIVNCDTSNGGYERPVGFRGTDILPYLRKIERAPT